MGVHPSIHTPSILLKIHCKSFISPSIQEHRKDGTEIDHQVRQATHAIQYDYDWSIPASFERSDMYTKVFAFKFLSSSLEYN